jgi:two-component system, chemotaxis family, protein-glutamate methylesterase/glutaminase
MATAKRLVVVGASAGGLSALTALLAGLDPSLPAGIGVVVHQPEGRTSVLADILDRAGPLPAVLAQDGQPIEAGRVHVAQAGFHLLCEGPRLRLRRGLLEHGFRPAIDPLFRTAASSFGPSTLALVLSGSLDDGSQGAQAVRLAGGRVAVQDPADAAYPDMPAHAIRAVGAIDVDAVVPADRLAQAVTGLVGELVDAVHDEAGTVRDPSVPDVDAGPTDEEHQELTCPSCSGPLHEEFPGDRFRCRIGHGFALETLAAAHAHRVEAGLWTAVRLLEERTTLLRRRLQRAQHAGWTRTADRLGRELQTAAEHERLLRITIGDLGEAEVRSGSLTSSDPAPELS